MKLNHTPGPWITRIEISDRGFDILEDHTKLRIVERYYNDNEKYSKIEYLANARLIAAAPEMLDFIIENLWEYTSPTERKAISIIERATGKSIEEVLK